MSSWDALMRQARLKAPENHPVAYVIRQNAVREENMINRAASFFDETGKTGRRATA